MRSPQIPNNKNFYPIKSQLQQISKWSPPDFVTVISPFLHTVDDGSRDLRTSAYYLLTDSFFQVGTS